MTELLHVLPADIEKTSFAIIKKELLEMQKKTPSKLNPWELENIIIRVIHTTADFDYANTLTFSKNAVCIAKDAIRSGADIVTDTNMTLAGINKKVLAKFGGNVHCFMADDDVAQKSKELKVTRATVSMQKAMQINKPLIFAIGNAPTALIELCNLIDKGFMPKLIIGVPVGFVNVVHAKELLMQKNIPYIVNVGRKGGSTVAAAICNAILYSLTER